MEAPCLDWWSVSYWKFIRCLNSLYAVGKSILTSSAWESALALRKARRWDLMSPEIFCTVSWPSTPDALPPCQHLPSQTPSHIYIEVSMVATKTYNKQTHNKTNKSNLCSPALILLLKTFEAGPRSGTESLVRSSFKTDLKSCWLFIHFDLHQYW